jgi:hypothetical protein
MPIASIDLLCTEGNVRVSFSPPLLGERFIEMREQFSDLTFEELSKRLNRAAVEWHVAVDIQLLPM